MSGEVETGSEQIQLHFCHRCGISIPQADIDTGRARAAPGGFVCAGCIYQQRSQDLGPLERREAVAGPAAGRETGSRLLITLALLYVVGATTFLLVKELNRQPPAEVELGNVATTDALSALASKVDDLDRGNRSNFTALKDNDGRQRGDVQELSKKLNELRDESARQVRALRTEIEDLQATVLAISNRTGLVKEDVSTLLEELRRLGSRVDETGAAARGKTEAGEGTGREAPPVKPGRTQEEIEREQQAKDYIAKLLDRRGGEKTNQSRYNAAVQLGDLKHPDSIAALIDALENDPYDLVRRAAAWSLGMFGKDAVPAIPELIQQIGGKEEYVGYMCERALGEITKAVLGKPVSFSFDPTMNSSQRRKVQKKWEEWWAKNRARLLPDG